jgi:class II poly(R)-hydroxyalkanoic acid synthase
MPARPPTRRSTPASNLRAAAAPASPRAVGGRAAAGAALDVLLTEAATDRGPAGRFFDGPAAVKVPLALTRRPRRVARRLRRFGSALARAAAGASEHSPAPGDRRFSDAAWQENWLLHRLMQSYLASTELIDGLIDDAELDWHTERRARFATGNLLDALAPTNFPWSNPAVMREIINSGGTNLVRGARHFLRDVSHAPHLPASVDVSRFTVGENLAVTPGSVVLRTEVFELIHYRPSTEQVWDVPLLFVPPTINRFYVLDIAPGRSVIEYLLAEGQQVFALSWANPDADHGHFGLDTYARAVLEARAAVAAITDQRAVHLNASCSGGVITAVALGHLAATGALADVASLTLWVCPLDNARAGTAAALTSRELAAAAIAESARKGYLDGQALAGAFAWLRPNDLIWNYVVNNYLLGKDPPAFDILYWNHDSVRLAAGLHRDFIRLALENSLTRPGALTALETPIDLSTVDSDTYIVAGVKDHIVAWQSAYRSTQLLGGHTRFVLSTSGHIQALVNPPDPASHATYRVIDDGPPDPEAWLAHTDLRSGSWWPDYSSWLAERSGSRRRAPGSLGNREFTPSDNAPGSYVHVR